MPPTCAPQLQSRFTHSPSLLKPGIYRRQHSLGSHRPYVGRHPKTNVSVRGKALISLAAMRDEEAFDLIDAMFDEAIDDPEMMSDVLLAMGESGDRAWLPAIEDAFLQQRRPSSDIRGDGVRQPRQRR